MRGIPEGTGNDEPRHRPGDLSAAQKPAGHSDPETTAHHDRRGERAMREAPGHPHVPHFGE